MRAVVCLLLLAFATAEYLPVFYMHGLAGSAHAGDLIIDTIKQVHPGQYAVSIPLFETAASIAPMPEQLRVVKEWFVNATANLSAYHVVAHSQGALLMRCLIEDFDDHKVVNFISLASPHMGVFGLAGWDLKVANDMYQTFYTPKGQSSLSLAAYWKDPHHYAEYLKGNTFLPKFNGEVPTADLERYKRNFLRLKNIVFVGGPDDDILKPWQTSLWQYYLPSPSGETTGPVQPMEMQDVFKLDTFGLKTMNDTGRLHMFVKPGVKHIQFRDSKEVAAHYVVPWV